MDQPPSQDEPEGTSSSSSSSNKWSFRRPATTLKRAASAKKEKRDDVLMSCWVKKKRVDKTTLQWNRRYFELSAAAIAYYVTPQVVPRFLSLFLSLTHTLSHTHSFFSHSLSHFLSFSLSLPVLSSLSLFFFLFSRLLHFSSFLTSLTKENPLGSMPLSGVEVIDDRDAQIRLKTSNREYAIIFDSSDICRDWVSLVRSLQSSNSAASRQSHLA